MARIYLEHKEALFEGTGFGHFYLVSRPDGAQRGMP
jgi:hypothetical protein